MILGRFIKQLRASYSAKLIAIFIVALCLMATALNITTNRIQKSTYTEYMRTSGLAMAQLLAKSVQLDVFTENIEELTIPVESLLSQDDILQVEILSRKGVSLVRRTKNNGDPMPSHDAILAEIQDKAPHFKEWPHSFSYSWPVEALATTSSADALFFGEDPEQLQSESVPLGYISIIVSKMHYTKNIRQMAIRTGLTILLLLILLTAGILLLFRRMTLPLRTLIHKIKEQHHIGEVHDDIGLLDTTVTGLITDLDHSFQTINDLTNSLEDKVTERTRQLAMANDTLITRQEYLEEANKKLEKAMKDLQEAEGQLIQSEKMAAIGQVVAGVAHEINNNINFISGALPSMDRSIADIKQLTGKFTAASTNPTPANLMAVRAFHKELGDDDLFESLDLLMANIREGVNRTTNIISDLKTFSRVDEQGYQEIDLNKSIDSTLTFLNKQHLQHVEIRKNYGALPLVSCLPGRINQVFLNIMNNALHAMTAQGGSLTITTFVKGSQAHIRFEDTGVGISKEKLPKIFDAFFTSKNIGEGSGIGLAISYKIIEQHKGRIEVTSEEGKGSNFEVILPIVSREEGWHG